MYQKFHNGDNGRNIQVIKLGQKDLGDDRQILHVVLPAKRTADNLLNGLRIKKTNDL